MEFNIEPGVIEIYLTLVVLINRIVAGFFTPIFDKFKIGKTSLMYLAWIAAAYITFSTGLNLFESIITVPIVGQVLTAIAVGGGANILYDVTNNEPTK